MYSNSITGKIIVVASSQISNFTQKFFQRGILSSRTDTAVYLDESLIQNFLVSKDSGACLYISFELCFPSMPVGLQHPNLTKYTRFADMHVDVSSFYIPCLFLLTSTTPVLTCKTTLSPTITTRFLNVHALTTTEGFLTPKRHSKHT